jgi:hypothetical protein
LPIWANDYIELSEVKLFVQKPKRDQSDYPCPLDGFDRLAQEAFGLYEQFRPGIPEGVGGWGAKGELDLNRVRALAPKK